MTDTIVTLVGLAILAVAAILGITGLVAIFRSHVPASEAAGDDLMAVAEAVREDPPWLDEIEPKCFVNYHAGLFDPPDCCVRCFDEIGRAQRQEVA